MRYMIVSVAAVAEALGIRSGNKQFDTRLKLLSETAALSIEQYTGRKLVRQQRTQLFDTTESVDAHIDLLGSNESGIYSSTRPRRLVLNTLMLDPTAGLTVWFDPSRQFSGPQHVVDPRHYELDCESGVMNLRFPTCRAMSALRIDHVGGWEVDPQTHVMIDPDPRLELAALTQVGFLWAKTDPDNVGMDSDRSKGSSSSRALVSKFLSPSGLTPEAAAMIGWMKPTLVGRY